MAKTLIEKVRNEPLHQLRAYLLFTSETPWGSRVWSQEVRWVKIRVSRGLGLGSRVCVLGFRV